MSDHAGEPQSLSSIVDWCVRHPARVLFYWLCLSAIAVYFVAGLRVDTTIGSALNRTDQSWRDYERSLELHGGDEFVAIALAPTDPPFSIESLTTILDLTEQFESLEDIRRVDGIASVPLVRTELDGSISVSPGLSRETLESREAIENLISRLRTDRIAPGSIISWDESVHALNLVFDRDVDGDREKAVARIKEILSAYPGAAISGVPVVRAYAGARTRREIGVFVPATILLINKRATSTVTSPYLASDRCRNGACSAVATSSVTATGGEGSFGDRSLLSKRIVE